MRRAVQKRQVGVLQRIERAVSNPTAPQNIGTVLIIAAGLYFGWCGINYFKQTGTRVWSWTPWK